MSWGRGGAFRPEARKPSNSRFSRLSRAQRLNHLSELEVATRALALLSPPNHAQKKSAHAAEQERPDVLKRRQDWFDAQMDLDPQRLVFIDETWASTNMARLEAGPQRRAAACRHPAWALEDDDLCGGLASQRHGGTDGPRRADQWRRLHSLCRVHPRAGTQAPATSS